ncbi:hypothetical protein [Pseudosulfitobacter pseudonitzschiae]|nr:hypothetical protein [Pseudosulfitobacter pseudonitzschiae]
MPDRIALYAYLIDHKLVADIPSAALVCHLVSQFHQQQQAPQ